MPKDKGKVGGGGGGALAPCAPPWIRPWSASSTKTRIHHVSIDLFPQLIIV